MTTSPSEIDYVDWCERVAQAFIDAWVQDQPGLQGVPISVLAERLGVAGHPSAHDCVYDAMQDLVRLGLADDSGSPTYIDSRTWRVTQTGEHLRTATLPTCWPQIFAADVLIDHQREYLRAVVDLCEVREEGMARTDWVLASDVAARLGHDFADQKVIQEAYAIAGALKDHNYVQAVIASGGHIQMAATYTGFVLTTRKAETEDGLLLKELLVEGEVVSTDFKRELSLGSDGGKAEFVRDVLGLANVQTRGRRFLVVGIDDDGNEFADAEMSLTTDRVQQIVQSWAPPAPPLSVKRVRLNTVETALIEVERIREQLPYVATKEAGKLRKGIVYSRHGTHTEPATPDEERSIREEGERARREASSS